MYSDEMYSTVRSIMIGNVTDCLENILSFQSFSSSSRKSTESFDRFNDIWVFYWYWQWYSISMVLTFTSSLYIFYIYFQVVWNLCKLFTSIIVVRSILSVSGLNIITTSTSYVSLIPSPNNLTPVYSQT